MLKLAALLGWPSKAHCIVGYSIPHGKLCYTLLCCFLYFMQKLHTVHTVTAVCWCPIRLVPRYHLMPQSFSAKLLKVALCWYMTPISPHIVAEVEWLFTQTIGDELVSHAFLYVFALITIKLHFVSVKLKVWHYHNCHST